jgi:hypothetical protein
MIGARKAIAVLAAACIAAGCVTVGGILDPLTPDSETQMLDKLQAAIASATKRVEKTNPATNAPATPAALDDATAWASIEWHESKPIAHPPTARVVSTLTASVNGDKIAFGWTPAISWPDKGGCMGNGVFLVWAGDHWRGGKFDHIRTGGQKIKLTENIADGYNGLREPASGTRVAFCWVRYDGAERTTIAETVWP